MGDYMAFMLILLVAWFIFFVSVVLLDDWLDGFIKGRVKKWLK